MRDLYQPGGVIVLPSGRRVVIDRVRPDAMICHYADMIAAEEDPVTLTRLFCDRHCLLVPQAVPA